jgi:hypothetical protein
MCAGVLSVNLVDGLNMYKNAASVVTDGVIADKQI